MHSLELFSGAGGLAKGLELAGFKHVALVERDKQAHASLRINFKEENIFLGDIKDFDFSSVGPVDVIAGGPPCQPFSLGGKHQANQDTRDMFPHAIRAIERLTPKAFVFENVKGLLRPGFANYFEYVLLRLRYPELGLQPTDCWQDHLLQLRRTKAPSYLGVQYNVHYKLMNAADYGAPQTRERVILVGVRSDCQKTWVFPEPTHSRARLLWDMNTSGDYWQRHALATKSQHPPSLLSCPTLSPWRTVRDVLSDLPDPRERHGIKDHVFQGGARVYPGHTGSDYDWPSKTIKAGGHGVPGGENMVRYADQSVRYFTVLEAKRLQTFPDDFVIKGAWGPAMRQIGNAVPVRLAETLGQRLIKTLQSA